MVQFNEGISKKIELAEKQGVHCKKNLLSDRQMRFSHAKNLGGLAPQAPDRLRAMCHAEGRQLESPAAIASCSIVNYYANVEEELDIVTSLVHFV